MLIAISGPDLSLYLSLAVIAAGAAYWWMLHRRKLAGHSPVPPHVAEEVDDNPTAPAMPMPAPVDALAPAPPAELHRLEQRLHELEQALTRHPADAAPEAVPSPAALRARVHALADAGLPPADIARELRLSRGEIDLIISLRMRG